MANQNISDDQSESRNTNDNTTRNESPDVVNVSRSRHDSEDSVPQCGAGNMCGVNGVICNSGSLLEAVFPYLSSKRDDDVNTVSPRDVRSIVNRNGPASLSPLSKPIRRGRFLVWPTEVDCGSPLSACSPITVTSSASSSPE